MKLLIIFMSVFLMALTPAKVAQKAADKYNSGYLARALKEIDKEIKKEMALGEYSAYVCIYLSIGKGQDIDKLISVLKKNGYGVRKLEQDHNNCYGIGVHYLGIGWQ